MTPDYSMMQQLLSTALPSATPASLHGLIAGLLASGAPDIDEEDIATLQGASFPPVIEQLLSRLIGVTREQLQQSDFSFTLLLPADDVPLPERVQELGRWCEGFTNGFSAGFVQSETVLGEEGREALADIANFAALSDEVDDGMDDDEADYMELVEYVRMATLTLFQLLAAADASESAETPSDQDQILH